MRISACLIVNLVRVHVKEGKPKSECNLIANGAPSRANKLFVSLSPIAAPFRHLMVRKQISFQSEQYMNRTKIPDPFIA